MDKMGVKRVIRVLLDNSGVNWRSGEYGYVKCILWFLHIRSFIQVFQAATDDSCLILIIFLVSLLPFSRTSV